MDLRKLTEIGTFENEEVVGVACVPTDHLPEPFPEHYWKYIPEPLWQRVLGLGGAYRLHFYSLADPVVDTVFNSKQCASLCDELQFLRSVVADDAAHQAIDVILGAATEASRDRYKSVVISPP